MRDPQRIAKQPSIIRCAIYTRKSSSEGLERDFNSLEAQREAAEAFILSQAGQGLVALSQRYDDGGYSGGDSQRPALRRLLEDIRGGRVDCVVVYKVDRLSRSLIDFSRIVGVFETSGVGFISVTQHFNTANPVGRLTLNILLSFAQFEREIISERTRDKIRAARQKGKWTGGRPVLGYDIEARRGRLIVNRREAEEVRTIFSLYVALRSLRLTVRELGRRRIRTKRWVTRAGQAVGGGALTKSTVYRVLRNRIYTGYIEWNGQAIRGEHEAIVGGGVWERARRLLCRKAGKGK